MTERHPGVETLFVTLRKIEHAGITGRDLIILYLIGRQPGIMGNEITKKLGYASRSNIQDNMRRLERLGLTQDRRVRQDRSTPNDWHITPAGELLLDDILPA